MIRNKVIVGEFENESYAIIAKNHLGKSGIKADILKRRNKEFIQHSSIFEGVRITVYETQLEDAKKILETKFI
ncbi:MAG: DUF2007 domain-containing protein [Bacteroidetes bacterium]|nr:DUF2007 domain-containing protein [Bacteroidota bacterium]